MEGLRQIERLEGLVLTSILLPLVFEHKKFDPAPAGQRASLLDVTTFTESLTCSVRAKAVKSLLQVVGAKGKSPIRKRTHPLWHSARPPRPYRSVAPLFVYSGFLKAIGTWKINSRGGSGRPEARV